MAKFKIPAVYVEEIPHVATIESISDTAVFLGYTEKHQNILGESLLNIPTKINSLPDFESNFGRAQKEENLEIKDISIRIFKKISVQFNGDQSRHNLYYAIKSFFDQGGESCKIVSTGTYKNIGEQLQLSDYLLALESLKIETGNVLISVPESQNLEDEDLSLLQQKILEFCENNLGFALLDLPKTSKENFKADITQYRNKLHSDSLSFGAGFFPNLMTDYSYRYDESKIKIKKFKDEFSLLSLKEIDPVLYNKYENLLQKFLVTIPPSATVAGLMIKNDVIKGIWKATANVKCLHIVQPNIEITTADQEVLNLNLADKNINCIRDFGEKGILIWGARTLGFSSAEFKYISVRRVTNLIQNDLKNALKEFTTEKISYLTFVKIKRLTENYLHTYFQRGAFPNYKPENCYFVKCGLGQTMTQEDIQSGNLILEVGIALIKPAEFIVIRIKEKFL